MMKMKTTLHKISIVCAAVMLAFPSCIKDTYIPDRTGGEGDSIILDIASETLPLMKSEASGAEIAVDHLDVLIFEENGAYRWHERITSLNGSREGTVTLSAKREDFTANSGYWVYLVANSSHPAEDFNNIDLNGLRSMIEETRNIHLTGWDGSGTESAPENFLMDGIAYPGANTDEPANPGAVVLNDGVVSNDTELKVTLRRAAAKIVVKIFKGEDVTFTDSGEAGFYLSNMPWTSSVVSGVDAPAELRTPELFRYGGTPFYDWTAETITVTTYAYAHEWADASALENELRLVVNIPLKYNPETSADDESAGVYEDSYYQIPVSRDKILERNTCYEVRVTVNTPGATNPSEPVTLDEIEYEVVDWTEKTINVGGEIEDAAYLSLNRYELELHNIEDDATSLVFASSSPVSVTVNRVWYIDKFGQESDVQYENVVESDNVPCITVAAESGLNGNLTIHSDLPTNNTIRYIKLTVSNEDYIDRTVVIRQYPLEYITNVLGWYSYREDFQNTTYLNKGGRIVSATIETENIGNDWRPEYVWDGWSYGTSAPGYYSSGFFYSKVTTHTYGENDGSRAGKSDIAYYEWPIRGQRPNTEFYRTAWDGGNSRMYHVQITSSSDQYTIGRPRITDGITDRGSDNAELVSPSFVIASQLGAVQPTSYKDAAADHCKQYVEVAENGTIYSDWRLPTEAELSIIMGYQYNSEVMDEVLAGRWYWSARNAVENENGEDGSRTNAYIRCIHDVDSNGLPIN